MGAFTAGTTDRLPVTTATGDEWIDVKHRLNAGEYEDMFEGWYDATGRFHASRVRRVKCLAYITGWSLAEDGKPVPFTNDALRALELPVFKAIADVVEAHEETSEAEAAVKKTEPAGVAA